MVAKTISAKIDISVLKKLASNDASSPISPVNLLRDSTNALI